MLTTINKKHRHCEDAERSEADEAILFDIIVSNPPYVPRWEIATLADHVRQEPAMALDGGEDGLDVIRAVITGAKGHLKPGGYLLMEIGYDQSRRVSEILEREGFKEAGFIRDGSRIDRIARARWIN